VQKDLGKRNVLDATRLGLDRLLDTRSRPSSSVVFEGISYLSSTDRDDLSPSDVLRGLGAQWHRFHPSTGMAIFRLQDLAVEEAMPLRRSNLSKLGFHGHPKDYLTGLFSFMSIHTGLSIPLRNSGSFADPFYCQ